MYISQGVKKKTYNIPGLGLIPITNLQEIDDDSILGKGMKKYHAQVCMISESSAPKDELLVEEPISPAEVIEEAEEPDEFVDSYEEPVIEKIEEDISDEEAIAVLDDEVQGLRDMDSFEDKEELEQYGMTFGIDLSRRKSLKNMYLDLVEHYASL